MLDVAIITTALLFVLIVLLVAALVVRRAVLAREERRERELLAQLRPVLVGWLGDPSGPPPTELTGAMDRRRREAVSRLLARYGSMLRGESRERLIAYVAEQGFVEAEVKELRSLRAWRRGRAARSLGDFGSARAVRHLSLVVVNDRDPAVRLAATRALGRIDDYKSAAALLMVLPTGRVPAGVVAQSLLDLGLHAFRPLVSACDDEDALTRETACRLLGLLGTAASVDGMRTAAEALRRRAGRDDEPSVRAAALGSLALLGDTRSADVVRDALDAPAAAVRRAAADAAGGLILRELAPELLGTVEAELLRPAPDWGVVRHAAHAWGQLADDLQPSGIDERALELGMPFLREGAAAAGRRLG